MDETSPTGTPTPFWSFSYSLDGNQQVRTLTDPIQGNGLHSYVRNKLDQLTGDAQTGGTIPTTLGLGYDSAYQLTSRSNSAAGTNSSYTADNADELTGLVTTTNGATTQNLSFTYDRNGDRLTQHDSVSGASATYGYDQENRLTSFSGGGHTASYNYDGDGLRQSKTVDSTTTSFTWDQSGSLPLLLQAGSTSYIDGPDGHPIEQITGSTPSYYLYDALGSVRGVLSATGGYTGYSYDAYGAITNGNTPTADYFGFAGEYTDAETGFEYLQARYYDPATGEFISVDPLKDITGQPYAYGGDNPLTWTDPTGLDNCGWDPVCWLLQGSMALVNGISTPAYAPGVNGESNDIAHLAQEAEAKHLGWALPYLNAAYQFYEGQAIDTLCNPQANGLEKAAALLTLVPIAKAFKALGIGGDVAVRWFARAARSAGDADAVWKAAADLASARALALKAALPASLQGRITMAVGVAEDEEGNLHVLIGTSEKRQAVPYIRKPVQPLIQPSDIVVPGTGHAEVNVVKYAQAHDWKILAVAATRKVCPACVGVIEGAGAVVASERK